MGHVALEENDDDNSFSSLEAFGALLLFQSEIEVKQKQKTPSAQRSALMSQISCGEFVSRINNTWTYKRTVGNGKRM